MYPTNNQFGGARSRYRSSGRCIPRPQILRYEVRVMVKDAMNLDGVADEAGGSV